MHCPLCLRPAPEGIPCPTCGFIPCPPEQSHRVSGYTIQGEIGRGGGGVVCLALQHDLERIVALKLLPRDRMTPEGENAFFREAKVAARLNHPGIVNIIESGRCEDGSCFFSMELVRGKTVESLLQSGGAMPVQRALEIVLPVAQALDYGYTKFSMIHGDIKPSNLLIRDTDGLIKLADFGLARFGAEPMTEEVSATPLYAAPEIFRDGQEGFSIHSDMYSFGIMLYELITGQAPFTGSVEELSVLHQERDAQPLSAVLPGCNPDLEALLRWLLARNPAARPEDWGTVIECLQDILIRGKIAKLPVAKAYPRPHRKKKSSRRRLLLLILLLLLLLTALWVRGRSFSAEAPPCETGFDIES